LLAALAKEKAPSRPKHRLTGEFASESTPLVAATTTKKAVSPASGAGTSWLRTIGGLLLVVGAIYGVAWVMRRVKRSREEQATGRGLTSIATLPLGAGRALHLVRAGSDVIVVGTSEHGVAPIQRYTEEEALANGVLDDGRRDGLMHEAAGAFMPDGSPQPPVASGWRAIDDGAGNPTMVDLLRRLTVRS
jgi:flagellar protein FliO/FliZ